MPRPSQGFCVTVHWVWQHWLCKGDTAGIHSLIGNAASWVLKSILTPSPYFSQAELRWSIFGLFYFLTATFSRLTTWSTVPDQTMNVYMWRPVSKLLHCSQRRGWSPDAHQDKKATEEEGRISCLARAVLLKSEMELTTHSNTCMQNTDTDCLALSCTGLPNPCEPCLMKQGEMIP